MKNVLLHGYLYRKPWITWVLLAFDACLSLLPLRRRSLPTEIKKILIVKPDHLGDFLLSTSIHRTLAENYPDATVDYLVGPWNEFLAQPYQCIRNIWTIRHAMLNRKERGFKRWVCFMYDTVRVIPKIRRERYDLVLLLRAFGGNFICLSTLFGARFVVGHGTGGGGALLDRVAHWQEGLHETLHYVEVLEAAGAKVDRDDVAPYFPDQKQPPLIEGDYVCIHPGAGPSDKRLNANAWREVLAKQVTPIAVCGTASETHWVHEFREMSNLCVHDFTRDLDLGKTQALMRYAKAVHTLDSFSAHFAATIGEADVTVHFLPASDVSQWGPVGERVKSCQHPASDSQEWP